MSKKPRKLMWFSLPRGSTIPISIPAPAEVLRFWRVVKLAPGDVFHGWIRSVQLLSTMVHYLASEKTYAPCLAEVPAPCSMCEHTSKRYFSALACYRHGADREAVIVCLPRMAVRGCPDLELLTGKDLVGKHITAKRGPFRKSRVEAWLGRQAPIDIPPEKWVRPSELLAQLLLVWGVRYREEGELAHQARRADLSDAMFDHGESAREIPLPELPATPAGDSPARKVGEP